MLYPAENYEVLCVGLGSWAEQVGERAVWKAEDTKPRGTGMRSNWGGMCREVGEVWQGTCANVELSKRG